MNRINALATSSGAVTWAMCSWPGSATIRLSGSAASIAVMMFR